MRNYIKWSRKEPALMNNNEDIHLIYSSIALHSYSPFTNRLLHCSADIGIHQCYYDNKEILSGKFTCMDIYIFSDCSYI